MRRGIAEGRLQEDDDFVRQPRLFASVQEAVESSPSQQELVNADDFDVGDVDAPKTRRKNMLNPDVGLTDLNCGRSCYIAGVLKPYKVVIEQLLSLIHI